jgi:ring-1,2-phenylacetyl-CoA epoxidase subunit PaaD
MTTVAATESDIWAALKDVPDPELPQISLVDLGVILRVELDEATQRVRVLLMPTFLGCPALGMMREMIHERLEQLDLSVHVDVTDEELWSSDHISAEGRRKLEEAGIAPPAPADASATILFMEPARCPHCGSRNTTLDTAFGPTLCRAIAYCRNCRQPFEQFKPL